MSDTSTTPKFIQLHVLTFYPPSNPNRDDLGRPKTAMIGGTQRQRISSQSLKRAWRTSDTFRNALSTDTPDLSEYFLAAMERANVQPHPHLGLRTKDIGIVVYHALLKHREAEGDFSEVEAAEWARDIADKFAVLKESSWSAKEKKKWAEDESDERSVGILKNDQLVHFGIRELEAIDRLVQTLAKEKREPSGGKKGAELNIIEHARDTVDIALFGRMLAGKNDRANIRDDGSVQVAHAVSVHEVEVEDDYYTAVDDLNLDTDAGQGSGFLDTAQFGSSLYYLYVCMDRELLKQNLTPGGEEGVDSRGVEAEEMTERTIKALVEAIVQVTPSGKRAPYGHHTYAHYVLAELGHQQPRGLHVAFQKAIRDKHKGYLEEAREALEGVCGKMDRVYGPCADQRYRLDFDQESGTLAGLKEFVASGGEGNWTPVKAEAEEPATVESEEEADA